MSTTITPTVGRKVWYRPSEQERVGENAMTVAPGEPLDATVVAVWNDNCVNLVIFDANGMKHVRCSAYLRQGEDSLPDWVSAYAEWMPYQIGQAKKAGDQSYIRAQALDMALRTPGTCDHHGVLEAAVAYQAHIAGQPASTVQTKTYADGTKATGTTPLPDLSPDEQDAATRRRPDPRLGAPKPPGYNPYG